MYHWIVETESKYGVEKLYKTDPFWLAAIFHVVAEFIIEASEVQL